MDKTGNCSQCDKRFSRKHLFPIINDLVRNKTAFRKVFDEENPKFCKTCKNKWLDLGKQKSNKVKDFIEKMTSLKKNDTTEDINVKSDTQVENDKTFSVDNQNVDDMDLAVPGPSGVQNNATSAVNDQLQIKERIIENKCYHCKQNYLECDLQIVEDQLLHNIAEFRKVFKDDPNYDPEKTKFCSTCSKKWKLLSTKRGSQVGVYISQMKSELKKHNAIVGEEKLNPDPCSSEIQEECTSVIQKVLQAYIKRNHENIKNFTDAKNERDYWYKGSFQKKKQ